MKHIFDPTAFDECDKPPHTRKPLNIIGCIRGEIDKLYPGAGAPKFLILNFQAAVALRAEVEQVYGSMFKSAEYGKADAFLGMTIIYVDQFGKCRGDPPSFEFGFLDSYWRVL